jgi:hypothetical protein
MSAGAVGGRPALGTLPAVWRRRLAMAAICVAAGLLSVALGPDNYWDLRFYHLYAPYTYLHDRYTFDIGPAQEQGFLNPVADFLLYGLVSSPLNETPRVIAFIMGAVHGLNAAFLFAIVCKVIRTGRPAECWSLRAVAWLMGVSGSAFISLLGTSSNDLTSALFVMGSLLGILGAADRAASGPPWRGFAAPGLLAGLGIGLKLTSSIYGPGLGVVAIAAAIRRRSLAALIVFGIAAPIAFAAVVTHHMLILWRDFENPFFPYMNQIFQSPYFEPEAIRDDRFLPHGLLQFVAFPFYWTWTDTFLVAELPFRDWRAAIAYVAMGAGLVALAVRWLSGPRRVDPVLAQTPGMGLVYTFVIVSYVCWLLGFAYYRYAAPLEMLSGTVTVGALIWLFPEGRLRVGAAFALLALAAVTSSYLDWGRRPYTDRYVDVQVPPLPSNAVVLIATWDPVAFFIPYANPSVQYIGIENNYLEISQHNRLAEAVKTIMSTPGRPKYAVRVDDNADDLNRILARFGEKLSSEPCEPIRTNLTGYDLALCRVAEP